MLKSLLSQNLQREISLRLLKLIQRKERILSLAQEMKALNARLQSLKSFDQGLLTMELSQQQANTWTFWEKITSIFAFEKKSKVTPRPHFKSMKLQNEWEPRWSTGWLKSTQSLTLCPTPTSLQCTYLTSTSPEQIGFWGMTMSIWLARSQCFFQQNQKKSGLSLWNRLLSRLDTKLLILQRSKQWRSKWWKL